MDINSLLGPLPTAASPPSATAAAGASSKGPLALDDFCSLPAAAPAPAAAAAVPAWQPQPQPQPAVVGGGGSDPFAASGAVHMMAGPTKQPQSAAAAASGPKLGPETAKAKDPFADLAFI